MAVVVAIPYLAFPDARERILPLPALVALARLPLIVLTVVGLRAWQFGKRGLAAIEVIVTSTIMALGSVPLAVGTHDLALDLSAIPWLLLLFALRVGLLRASTRREVIVSVSAALPLVGAAVVRTMHDDSLDHRHPGWVAILVVVMWSAAGIAVSTVLTRAFGRLRDAVDQARRLGPYTIEAKIGQGGMGAVFRAHHALLRRPAAIKLLEPRLNGALDLERFELEARHTSYLSHPNIVSIFDYGRTPEGGFYYVMEYLDGYNLQELVRHHGPLPAARAVRVLSQICDALAEAHGLGLIHRDIKPANIILTTRITEPDVVKVVDFGLVHAVKDERRRPSRGRLVGTLGYMSPEMLRGEAADPRSDLYALGASAFFVLTGREVFRGGTDDDLIARHLTETPRAPSHGSPLVPAELDAIVLRCLAKAPEDRFSSAVELQIALSEVEKSYPYDAEGARRWWRDHAIRPPTSKASENQWETLPIDLRHRVSEAAATVPDRRT